MLAPLRRLLAPALLRHMRPIGTTPALQGLEEFMEPPAKDGKVDASAGRGWEASELRLKSWDDLHKLWYVCLKEQNMLKSSREAYRRQGKVMPNPTRLTKVRRSMCRIKLVLTERAIAIAETDPQTSRDLRLFVNAL